MKRTLFIFCAMLCIVYKCFPQKQTTQTIDATGIKTLLVESNEVFRISLKTAPTKNIKIKTASEGEYYNDISLITEIKGETLRLTSTYPQILTSGFDKLSAHKVFAIEVMLEIPESLTVYINSNVASVFGSGIYNDLQIELKSGQCALTDFKGDLLVNTYNGNISVETISAEVEAESRHGTVENNLPYSGSEKLKLKTIHGNILVSQSH